MLLMPNHAAQHKTNVEAAGNSAVSPTVTPAKPAKSSLLLAALAADREHLKGIRSLQRRTEIKCDLLPKYADYLTTVVNGDDYRHDEILVTCCLWSVDAGKYQQFNLLAEFALKHGMKSPQGFTRNLPELLMEELADITLRHKEPILFSNSLELINQLTDQHDVLDEIAAKFHKARGMALESSQPEQALQAYYQAQRFGAAVKRVIRKLEGLL